MHMYLDLYMVDIFRRLQYLISRKSLKRRIEMIALLLFAILLVICIAVLGFEIVALTGTFLIGVLFIIGAIILAFVSPELFAAIFWCVVLPVVAIVIIYNSKNDKKDNDENEVNEFIIYSKTKKELNEKKLQEEKTRIESKDKLKSHPYYKLRNSEFDC